MCIRDRLSDDIKFNMSDNEVKSIISTKVDESIVSAFEVLRNRIDGFGVTSPNIQRLGNSGRILLELPGARDRERVVELITTTAQLQFWATYTTSEIAGFVLQVNQRLITEEAAKSEAEESTTEAGEAEQVKDSTSNTIESLTGQIEQDTTATQQNNNPLGIQSLGQGGPVIGTFLAKDKGLVIEKLNANRDLLPAEQRYVRFAWAKPQDKDSEFLELYACLLYTSPSPRDLSTSRMPSSA